MNEIGERPLAVLLGAKMRKDGLTLEDLASRLSIGQSYLSQLLRGVKRMDAAGDAFLRASAEYLGMPAVTAYLLAGRLTAADFFEVPGDGWLGYLNEALRKVAESRIAEDAAVTHAALSELPAEVKLLLVQLFEHATATVVLPKRLSVSDISNFGKLSVPFQVRQHVIEK
jgi:transcriptional regulator with XRE-family HTH domain